MTLRSCVILLCCSIIWTHALGQKVGYTKRERNEVREGPGNYYPLIVVLRKGVEVPMLDVKEGWIKCYTTRASERATDAKRPDWWIAANTLLDRPPAANIRSLNLEIRSTKATASAVMAAVRGFAMRYGKVTAPIVDSLLALEQTFQPDEFLVFRQEHRGQLPTVRSLAQPDDEAQYLREYELTVAEEGIGLGIVSRIVSVGVSDNKRTHKYLNMLAAALAEVSGAYDASFTVYVTTDKEPKAFSAPGGYIVVSEGLLRLCDDEAEVAAVLSHEIMHIVLRHGLKEQHQRRHRIRMEEAFEELDDEVSAEQDSVVTELEEFAQEAYEAVVKPRLQTYEEEADRGALLILVKAGYDPMAISRMITKIRDVVKSTPTRRLEDNPFAHLDFERRNAELLKYMQKNIKSQSGLRNERRFRQWMNH